MTTNDCGCFKGARYGAGAPSMVVVTGSVTKRPRDRDLPVGTDATSTPRGVRPRATGETDVMVLDRGRSAHNPAVATQPRPLPIGLSRANGQLWGSCYSPLNGIRRDDEQRSRGRILVIHDLDPVRLTQLSCLD